MTNRREFDQYPIVKLALAFITCTLLSGTPLRSGTPVFAGESPAPEVGEAAEDDKESILDAIWNIPVLYSNEENSFLKEFRIVGRYQGQYAVVDSDQGDFDDWVNRPWRVGAQAKLFDNVTLFGNINIDDDFNPFYKSIDDAHITVKVSDVLSLRVGKQKTLWSYEWSTSSKKLLTFERGLLVNQTLPNRSSGVTASGSIGNWSYNTSVFSGDPDDEFGSFDGGTFYLGSIGYDFSESVGMDKAAWRLDYLYNDREEGDTGAKPYEHSWATSVAVGTGPFNLVNEFIYVTGESPDAYGLSVMPSYDITEKLQIVARYQYANGDDDGLRSQKRYERSVPNLADGGQGEEYHAIYAGLNYYIYGHKLQLMTGVEYATMDGGSDGGDYDGWTGFSGIRLYF